MFTIQQMFRKVSEFIARGKQQKAFEFPMKHSEWGGSKHRYAGRYSQTMVRRIERRRARNKVARRSRRVNRLRAA